MIEDVENFPHFLFSPDSKMQRDALPWEIDGCSEQLSPGISEEDDLDYLATNIELGNSVNDSLSSKMKRKRSFRETSMRSFEGAGVLPPPGEPEWDPSKQLFHTGKWPIEEERYANKLVLEFEAGMLDDCRDGVTLRSYLAKTLRCAPMRVSKKLAGKCIGSKVFCRQQGDRKKFLEEIAAGELDASYLQTRNKEKKVSAEITASKFSRSRSSSDLTDDESTSGSSSGSDDRDDCESDFCRSTGKKVKDMRCFVANDVSFINLWCNPQEPTAVEDIFACPLLADFESSIENGSYHYPAVVPDAAEQATSHILDVGYDEWSHALSYFQASDYVSTPYEEL